MKILQVAPAYYPAISIGGPIFVMLELQKQLTAEGHFIDTLTTHLGLTDAEKQQLPLDSIIDCSEQNRRIYKRFYGHPHYTFSPSTLIWLMRHVNEYDVVLIHGIWNFPILLRQLLVVFVTYPISYSRTVRLASTLFLSKKPLLRQCCWPCLSEE